MENDNHVTKQVPAPKVTYKLFVKHYAP